MKIVKKADKEASLIAFLAEDLNRAALQGADTAPLSYTLIVRSQNSPAARALATISEQLKAVNATVRVVFATSETNADAEIESPAQILTAIGQCRILCDHRFVDAHEQLVLGTTTAWIGDCMRRDPTRRDAFENFAPDCAITALFAANGFERLWRAATPIQRKRVKTAHLADAQLVAADQDSNVFSAVAEKPVAGTRH